MPRIRRAVPVALAAVAVALLGACGDDDSSRAPSGAAAGAENAGGGAGGDANVCDVVAPETAERLVGDSSGEVVELSVNGDEGCTYAGKDGATLNVGLGAADSYDAWLDLFDTKPVDGIGDRAAETVGKIIYQVAAVKGDRFVQFSVGPPVSDSGKMGTIDRPAVRQALVESLKSL
jgi:hypothetical protein